METSTLTEIYIINPNDLDLPLPEDNDHQTSRLLFVKLTYTSSSRDMKQLSSRLVNWDLTAECQLQKIIRNIHSSFITIRNMKSYDAIPSRSCVITV